MSISATAAVAIGLGAASAATQVYSAKKQSGAAKDAAAAQSASVDQALGVQREALNQQLPIYEQVYNDQRAGMDPYAQTGRDAMGTLGRLMTPGVPYSPDLQAQDAAANAARPTSWAPQPMPFDGGMPPPMGDPPPDFGGGGGPMGPPPGGQGDMPPDVYQAMLAEQAAAGVPMSRIRDEQAWDPRQPQPSTFGYLARGAQRG